jgi:hypothetical protein
MVVYDQDAQTRHSLKYIGGREAGDLPRRKARSAYKCRTRSNLSPARGVGSGELLGSQTALETGEGNAAYWLTSRFIASYCSLVISPEA